MCHYIIAKCDPPCRPEGKCVRSKADTNICSCPKGLRGDQCQHGEYAAYHCNTNNLHDLHATSVNDYSLLLLSQI